MGAQSSLVGYDPVSTMDQRSKLFARCLEGWGMRQKLVRMTKAGPAGLPPH